MLHQLYRSKLLRATANVLSVRSKYFSSFCSCSIHKYLSESHFPLTYQVAVPFQRPRFSWKICQYSSVSGPLQPVEFEHTCKETLESLVEYFEELAEGIPVLKGADITYSDGVLTAFLGEEFGTYVINRQTPNQQIWLSSPTSGPKRYDFVGGAWIYKHDNTSLHSLLDREIGSLVEEPLQFSSRCSFGVKK